MDLSSILAVIAKILVSLYFIPQNGKIDWYARDPPRLDFFEQVGWEVTNDDEAIAIAAAAATLET